jgi:hypothetical protein
MAQERSKEDQEIGQKEPTGWQREERKEDKRWIKNDNWRPEDVNGAKKTKTQLPSTRNNILLLSLCLL